MRRVSNLSNDGAPVVLTPRDLRFETTPHCVRLWRDREPEAAALYNSLSALFPEANASSSTASDAAGARRTGG